MRGGTTSFSLILTVLPVQAAKTRALPFGTDKENAGAGKAEHDDAVNLDVEVSAACTAPATCSSTP